MRNIESEKKFTNLVACDLTWVYSEFVSQTLTDQELNSVC